MSHHSDQRILHGTEDPIFRRRFWAASSQVAGEFSSSQRDYHPYSGPCLEPPAGSGDSFEDQLEAGGYFGPQATGTSSEGAVGVGVGVSGFAAGTSGTQRTLDTMGPQNGLLDGQKARPTGHFPHRLHRLLGDPRAQGIIEWNEAGDEIIVVNHTALENSGILNHYFNHNKACVWASVVKQLGNHLFTKDNRAEPGGRYHIYYHHKFLRGREELLDLIKPRAQGSDPPKTLIAKLQKKLEELRAELSHSEANASQLEKDKKKLEENNQKLVDKNKRLENDNKRLEDRNERLEGRNERLHIENGRLEDELRNLQMHSSHVAAPTVPYMPLSYYQAAGNGNLQAGGATPSHSQQWPYTNQPLSNTFETIHQSSDHQGSNQGLVQGTAYSNLPYQQPMNASGAMLSGSSGPCEVQPLGEEAIAPPAVVSQIPEPRVARRTTPKGTGVLHARSGVSLVSKQQPQNQETWLGNWWMNIQGFGSPSTQQWAPPDVRSPGRS